MPIWTSVVGHRELVRAKCHTCLPELWNAMRGQSGVRQVLHGVAVRGGHAEWTGLCIASWKPSQKINMVLIENKCAICKAKKVWNAELNPECRKDSIIPPCDGLWWWRLEEVGNGRAKNLLGAGSPGVGMDGNQCSHQTSAACKHLWNWCQWVPCWCWATFQGTSHSYSICSSDRGWWGRANVISGDKLQR